LGRIIAASPASRLRSSGGETPNEDPDAVSEQTCLYRVNFRNGRPMWVSLNAMRRNAANRSGTRGKNPETLVSSGGGGRRRSRFWRIRQKLCIVQLVLQPVLF
jgi:hypothetical protein